MSGQRSATVPQTPPTAPKVVVLFRATGDAPILKQNKFKIGGSEKFAKVIDFLRKQLHRETVFVYINSAFSPNPDEVVIDLFENFGIDGLPLPRTRVCQVGRLPARVKADPSGKAIRNTLSATQ